ncbi:YsnF/AvaK domain-containing protein [Ramlibacter sp. MMS24-I3-19]|uniref:YsnF/AvaK domain-containing protein n=1 Tax=Ramlibacter sp. MMS24-I3-19 TaxID=3416606 RepID=UPI003D01630D
MQTVIGAFDSQAQAQQAKERLIRDGFGRDDVGIEPGDPTPKPLAGTARDGDMDRHEPQGRIGHFFAELFGTSDLHRHHSETYQEAVRRGSYVVVVDAQDDAQAEKAATCLHEAGAINVDERVQQWRKEGWTGGQPMQGQAVQGQTQARGGTQQLGEEGKLDVVEEQLHVGKRSFENGGIRVVQRITEKPVREVVRLREEHAVVERRPVDRPVQPGELEAFREGTLEVRETAEEPVVAKTARVVEEVRVGKEVKEREQVVEDKVRRKDVDVQRMGGERERAVASDTRDPLANSREPDADRPLTGTRPRKNDPLA